jgi:hypothetical protein
MTNTKIFSICDNKETLTAKKKNCIILYFEVKKGERKSKSKLGLLLGTDAVHTVDVALIEILDLFSFEFLCGSHESGIRVPGFGNKRNRARNFEFLKFELQAVIR